MSVSRVEYDAALTRVRRAGLLAGAPHHLSIAERVTLAALGLDEPPTGDEFTFTPEHVTPEQIEALSGLLATPCVEGDSVDEPPTAGDEDDWWAESEAWPGGEPRQTARAVRLLASAAMTSAVLAQHGIAHGALVRLREMGLVSAVVSGSDQYVRHTWSLTGAGVHVAAMIAVPSPAEPPKADEPPTEAKCPLATPCKDVRICTCGVDNRPSAEPPKACPTCGGTGRKSTGRFNVAGPPCPACKGSGAARETPKVCKRCMGKGEVPRNPGAGYAIGRTETMSCPNCKGSGIDGGTALGGDS